MFRSKKPSDNKNNRIPKDYMYGNYEETKNKKGGFLFSDKIDIELVQDVLDRMLESGEPYIKELTELNKKYCKENSRHKREARRNKLPSQDKISIEKTTLPK